MASPAYDLGAVLLEPRPFRPFKSSEEYLWAMKEDLAEWLNGLYNLNIAPEDFLDRLETGVLLCQHANQVLRMARSAGGSPIPLPQKDVVYRYDVQPGTFHARDNVSNFIAFCRALEIKECLLFETEDLVMRKNERSFILCLLEVARRGARVGMPAPLLVQMEQEIDAELECDSDEEPPRQIITNDLRSLHERVVDLLNRCTCPSQFPMIRVADGKYRIGDTKVLIFVRILRSHVMVRVGGGWDTLEHYLDKHDPCRCRSGHRTSTSAKLTMTSNKGGCPTMQVTYNRPPAPPVFYGGGSPQLPRRSYGTTGPMLTDHDRELAPSRISHCSDDSSASSGGCGGPIDSSSETSEGEFTRTTAPRKCSPRKIPKTGGQPDSWSMKSASPERPDSGLAHESSETSSVVSTDENNSIQQQQQNGTSPRRSSAKSDAKQKSSKIPHISPSQRAISSEDICSVGLSVYNKNSRRQSSTPPNTRRKSTDAANSIPRSRSHSSDVYAAGEMSLLNRGLNGRLSWRSPPTPRSTKGDVNAQAASKTWTFRQRSPRLTASPDLYKSPSPKRTSNTTQSQNRTQQNNAKVHDFAPVMRELLDSGELYNNDKVLENIELLLNKYKAHKEGKENTPKEDSPVKIVTSKTTPTTPESYRSPPCRRKGSKIPMANFYGRD